MVLLNKTVPKVPALFDPISSLPLHVPWHVHMLIADGFATWMSQLIQYKCFANNIDNEIPSYINSTIQVIKKSPITINGRNTLRYGIARPLRVENYKLQHFRCNTTNDGILVDSSPNSTFVPSQLTYFEKSLKGWTAYQDYERKPPGWIINNYAPVNKRTLNFTIPKYALHSDKQDEIGLRIKYLKTYINAGHFNIIVCGVKVSEIDVLTKAHVSIPTLRYHIITRSDIDRCKGLADRFC